jgi:hypothetical protein
MSHKVSIASTPVVVKGPIRSWPGKEKRGARDEARPAQIGAEITRNTRAVQRRRRSCQTTARWRIGHPGAMGSAASVWPHAALQRLEALEPAPFVPQRLGLDLLEAPKPPTARPRVVAAACALPAARLLGAEAERSQQIALRAPDQIGAHARRARQPLFEREPPRKASRGSSPRHNLSFENARMSFCEMSFCDMRPFVVAMPLRIRALPTPRKAKPRSIPKKTPPSKEGRRSADRRVQEPHRIGMRRASFLLSSLRKNRGRADLMERARSPFGAPPRHPRFWPRLGSGRASWNHRMQTGGPSPAPVQRAPRSPTRAGRDDAQAARERSVSLRPTRTAPAPP